MTRRGEPGEPGGTIIWREREMRKEDVAAAVGRTMKSSVCVSSAAASGVS